MTTNRKDYRATTVEEGEDEEDLVALLLLNEMRDDDEPSSPPPYVIPKRRTVDAEPLLLPTPLSTSASSSLLLSQASLCHHRRVWVGAASLFVLLTMISSLHDTRSYFLKMKQHILYSSNPNNNNNNNNNKGTTTAAAAASKASPSSKSSLLRGETSPTTFAFRYRGPKLNESVKSMLAQQWGQWQHQQLVELDQHQHPRRRPALPCHAYDHCDVPHDQLPPHAWQADVTFLEPFLTQAQQLVTRAQEAILAEYGQSKFDHPLSSNNLTFAERSRNFQLDFLRLNGTIHPPNPRKVGIHNGGWTTPRSFQGLVRRLLHAIMTQDTFTFALGGHSAAAGHGNLFKQSYSMQFHRVMEPVLGRLGVKLITHNFGKGGRGTTQDSLGMGTLWGSDIDFCMWDAGMLEFKSSQYDLFARQALIGGNRVPVLWNGYVDVMEDLHNGADVDIGGHGSGLMGIPFTKSTEQAWQLPYAVRYLRCPGDRKDLCDDRKYKTTCWVKRPDVKPPVKQNNEAGGQMTQHPGFRMHQLTGRVLAFTFLMALQEGLEQWKKSPNYALPDSAWHVSEYYQNIRTKLAKLTTTACFNETLLPSPRVCSTPMKGVSEYTPRGNPDQSSIRSIMIDTSYVPAPEAALYEGPDVWNPILEPPQGEVDYLAIVENDNAGGTNQQGRHLLSLSAGSTYLNRTTLPSSQRISNQRTANDKVGRPRHRRLNEGSLPIGRGWALHIPETDSGCNGTIDSACFRFQSNPCLLYGHNDGKGGLVFDSFSGWLLMRLNGFKHGLIIIKMETWQHRNLPNKWSSLEYSELTQNWTEENNGMDNPKKGARRRLSSSDPFVPVVAPELCPEYKLEFAINGRIQSYSKDEFFEKRIFVQKLVETWTLLDDPNFTKGKEVNVEFGIRMQGCKRLNSLKLTHVYWA